MVSMLVFKIIYLNEKCIFINRIITVHVKDISELLLEVGKMEKNKLRKIRNHAIFAITMTLIFFILAIGQGSTLKPEMIFLILFGGIVIFILSFVDYGH